MERHWPALIALSILSILYSTPGLAQDAAASPSASAKGSSPGAEAAETDTLGKMVRSGIDLSWLFEPVMLKHIVASPEEQAKAQSLNALARVAVAHGLENRADVSAAIRAADTLVLAEAARRDLIDSVVVRDDDVAARIAKYPGRYDEYQLSHVFVAVGSAPDGSTRSEPDALAIIKKIRARVAAGEPFAKVAEQYSEDKQTAPQGGMLSTLIGVTMNAAFFPAVQALATGGVTEPVRGPEGYHLIRLEARKRADVGSARFWVEQDIISEQLPQLISKAVAEASRAPDTRRDATQRVPGRPHAPVVTGK